MDISVELVRQRWREKAGFRLNRPDGANCYILLHFLTPVELTYGGETVAAPCGSLIVFSPGYPHGFTSEDVLIHDWMHLSGDVDLLMDEYGLKPNTLYQPEIESAISEITGLLETEFFARRLFWHQLAQVKVSELFIRTAQAMNNPFAPASARKRRRLCAGFTPKCWPNRKETGLWSISQRR